MTETATGWNGRGAALLRAFAIALLLTGPSALGACVQANPATDVGNPVAPSPSGSSTPSPSPTPPSPTPASGAATPVAYTPDLQPVFQSDCVICHGGSRPSAGYSMSTYAGVMRDVKPGNAQSRLVVWTQPGGTMYRFWTGNAAAKAAMVRQWVVVNNAQQAR
jgi:hypothetical protein